jgi:tetratricopeptide (TPR) repeat protein
MYRFQGNRTAAIDAFNRAAQDSPDPYLIYLALAYTLLEDKRPGEALRAFDRADRTAPSADSALAADDTFPFSVAHGRSLGFFALGDIPRAVSYQEEAIRMEPQRADLWLELSALYELSGRNDEARQAKIRANAIQGGTLR